MPEYLVRSNEACAPDPFLLWDSVHESIEDGTDFICDWRLAAPGLDNLNVGGLQAITALGTAAYLLLGTDVYCPPDHPLAYLADGDYRGWWGDGVDVRDDLNERPLGSLLYLLERAPLVAAGVPIEQWAKTFAVDALAVLQTQGAVVKIECDSGVDVANSRVWVTPRLFARDGTLLFDGRYEVVWSQLN